MTKKLESYLKGKEEKREVLSKFRKAMTDQIGPMTTREIWTFFGDSELIQLRNTLPIRSSVADICNHLVDFLLRQPTSHKSAILLKLAQDHYTDEIYPGCRQDLNDIFTVEITE